MAGHIGEDGYTATVRLGDMALWWKVGVIRIGRVVSTLDVDRWFDAAHDCLGGTPVEDRDKVYAFEGGEDFGAFTFRRNRSSGAFQPPYRDITVDRDGQGIAQLTCLLQISDVAQMQ